MPKTNDATGPSYYGYEGHVVDGHDRVWEVDPSRNVDGSVKEGFDSDERDIEQRDPQGNVDTVSPLGNSDSTFVQTSPQFGLPDAPRPVADVQEEEAARANVQSIEDAGAGREPTPGVPESERQIEQEQGGEQSSDGNSSEGSQSSSAKSESKKTSAAKRR